MISDYLKAKLSDVLPGILTGTSHLEGGKQILRINAETVVVGPFASDNEIEAAIRLTFDMPEPEAHITPVPSIGNITPLPVVAYAEQPPKAAPMTEPTTPQPGGFAASLRAIVDDARAGIAQARADGLAEVQSAVGDLHKAKDAVKHVTGKMAGSIRAEVDDIRAELGQISNDLGE